MRLVEAGWDAEVARRPHGQHTTVVVHLDVSSALAALHLGPLLTDAERRYLTCDATCEVWFERDGQVIGAGRATRLINRRLRRALEHRHRHLRGPRLRGHPRSARPPHPALGRRRPHRAGQPGAGLPVSPPAAPSRRHHHHRTRTQPHRHRQRRPSTERWITSAPTDQTPARRSTLPRPQRRTRRLVVVPTLPTATTTGCLPISGDLTRFVARLPDHQRGALGHDRDIATLLGAATAPARQPSRTTGTAAPRPGWSAR